MNILLSTTLIALLFIGCSEDANKSIDKVAKETKEVVAQTKEVTKVVKEETSTMLEQAEDMADNVVYATKEAAVEVKKVASESYEATKKSINEVAVEIQKVTATVDNGELIYKACSACHGASGEKKALGKSEVIQGWTVAKVEHSLNGYKDGSYGGTMKGLMKGQVSKLSSDDIEAVATYISKL